MPFQNHDFAQSAQNEIKDFMPDMQKQHCVPSRSERVVADLIRAPAGDWARCDFDSGSDVALQLFFPKPRLDSCQT